MGASSSPRSRKLENWVLALGLTVSWGPDSSATHLSLGHAAGLLPRSSSRGKICLTVKIGELCHKFSICKLGISPPALSLCGSIFFKNVQGFKLPAAVWFCLVIVQILKYLCSYVPGDGCYTVANWFACFFPSSPPTPSLALSPLLSLSISFSEDQYFLWMSTIGLQF